MIDMGRERRIMKKTLMTLGAILLLGGSVGVAGATPVSFDLAGLTGGSSVTATGTPSGFGTWGDITASLVGNLDSQMFTLNDGETQTVDFFTLTACGLSWNEDYTVEATLAFDLPDIGYSSGSGSGTFGTFFGALSGGTLTWDPATLPDTFIDIYGNTISVNFESGCTIGFGNTATLHAYITNLGGGPTEAGAAPVPEPATILLMGIGMASLGFARIKKQKKS